MKFIAKHTIATAIAEYLGRRGYTGLSEVNFAHTFDRHVHAILADKIEMIQQAIEDQGGPNGE
jgi:hypothetical protein